MSKNPGFPPDAVHQAAVANCIELLTRGEGEVQRYTLNFCHIHVGPEATSVVMAVVALLESPGVVRYIPCPFDVETARAMATEILGACVCPEDVEKLGD